LSQRGESIMIGWRGAITLFYSETFRDKAFVLESQALKWTTIRTLNITIMIPFVRTAQDIDQSLGYHGDFNGLKREGKKVWKFI